MHHLEGRVGLTFVMEHDRLISATAEILRREWGGRTYGHYEPILEDLLHIRERRGDVEGKEGKTWKELIVELPHENKAS